ncbi:FUSC family protein [Pseudonocardia alni]|uniref:DUF4913 domain-containing protein n=1 Tax=Pseudonocardia alni TaxID=33907 RepID=A0AA44UMK5_PSEA5|nr:hypothetical protein [Pseudonocardia alni]PKB30207.1 hypothetical protein ATL51_1866 [Pseudonocardia alni]
MNPPSHPEPGDGGALARLAGQVDTLRRQVAELEPIRDQVGELGRLVGQLSEALAAVTARRRIPAAPSWLLAPTDTAETRRLLDELCGWAQAVFLRYPDAAKVLPECWLWHPEVVEELLWLMHAWLAAYQGPAASVGAAGDWHDRQRPGVVNRIRKEAGSCSIERHQTRPGWSAPGGAALPVPGTDHVEEIARWWAGQRDQAPPEPAPAVDAGPIGTALR